VCVCVRVFVLSVLQVCLFQNKMFLCLPSSLALFSLAFSISLSLQIYELTSLPLSLSPSFVDTGIRADFQCTATHRGPSVRPKKESRTAGRNKRTIKMGQ
jgi:hypothetical protein